MAEEAVRQCDTHPFGHRLAQYLHPVGHILLVVGAQLQWGTVCQDHLEGVRPLGAVGASAASAMLPAAGRERNRNPTR